MCGIVGYIGANAVQNVLNGLETLEYRGYDSAGIAVSGDGSTKVIKREGRLEVLKQAVTIDGDLAIGHTRWATHGKANRANAHPHTSRGITIVHNGIIENCHVLRGYEWLRGREFTSETDSELIAHIIDIVGGDNLYSKVSKAITYLEGSYALAVISEDEPDTIVVARKHSPLVVGVFDKGAIIASDIQAVLPHTNKVVVLDDNDIGVVRKSELKLYQNGQEIIREPLEIAWSVTQNSKGDAKTFMEKEIYEQPVAIYDTMMNNNWEQIAEKIFNIYDENTITNVTLLACGTSLHACMIGAMLIEGAAHISARARLASELELSSAVLSGNLVIAFSQSGETCDTLQAIRYAKRSGAIVISIINTIGSSIERESDYIIYTMAGREVSVASTKCFVSQLAVVNMLVSIIEWIKCGNPSVPKKTQDDIYRCADAIQYIFDQKNNIKRIALDLSTASTALYIGRGLHVPIALEGALKLKEISYIHAEGFAAGELKHGSIALIERDTPVVAVIVKGLTYRKMVSNMEEAKARGARIIAIALEGDHEIKKIADEVIYIPDVNEALSPILSVIPLQLLAMYTAEALSRNIDFPKNLAKTVTVE